MQLLTDIPFHLRPRPALSFMAVSLTERERAEEKAMETLFQTLAVCTLFLDKHMRYERGVFIIAFWLTQRNYNYKNDIHALENM